MLCMFLKDLKFSDLIIQNLQLLPLILNFGHSCRRRRNICETKSHRGLRIHIDGPGNKTGSVLAISSYKDLSFLFSILYYLYIF